MAITLNVLSSALTLAPSTNTSTFTPTAAAIAWAILVTHGTSNAGTIANGNGITWTLEDQAGFGSSSVISTFHGIVGTPSAGALPLSAGGGTDMIAHSVFEFPGVDSAGTIVQKNAAVAADASISVPLGAFSNAANATLVVMGTREDGTFTMGSGITGIYNQNSGGGIGGLTTGYQLGNNTNPGFTLVSGLPSNQVAYAYELKAATVVVATPVESWLPQAGMIVLPHLGMLASGTMPGSRVP